MTLALAANVSRAQVVHGTLVSAADAQPVPYGTIVVGDQTPGRFTDGAGQFLLGVGSHRIRARALGFLPLDTTVTVSERIVLALRPLAVDPTSRSTSLRRCTAPGLSNDPIEQPVLALLRDNVDRYQILVDQYPFRYRWAARSYLRLTASERGDAQTLTGYSPGTDSTVGVDTTWFDSNDRRPYAVGAVVSHHGSTPVMALPTLRDLADPAYTATHCFAFASAEKHELRIDFRPVDSIRAPDVTGSVYLDATRYIVRRIVFQLTHPETVNPALDYLTVTTTFREVVPLVPIVDASRTEQHVHQGATISQESVRGQGVFVHFAHPDQEHLLIDDGRMLDHTFVGDTLGSLAVVGAPRAPAENTKVSIRVACELPPSFETADIAIYATLAGPGANGPSAIAALAALRPMFRMPSGLTLSVYSYANGRKVAQTLDGEVAFALDAGGHLSEIVTAATSLSPAVDSALVAAVRDAGAAGAFARMHGGRYTLSLSAATPPPTSRSLLFARIETNILPLARAAALDADSTQPRLPVGGPFQFVVDEHGRAMPTTLRTLTPSPDAVMAAALRALPALRFKPAVAGECPIKQQVTLTGASGAGN